MPLLFNAFIAAPAGQRNHIGRCISAYAAVADPALLETFFKTVIKKLIKVLALTVSSSVKPLHSVLSRLLIRLSAEDLALYHSAHTVILANVSVSSMSYSHRSSQGLLYEHDDLSTDHAASLTITDI